MTPLTGSDPKSYSINMPAKNSVKTFIENCYYHVYNRGVEQRNIFLDDLDFRMFLFQLKYYLETPSKDDIKQQRRTLSKEIVLIAYCLMPNHFHILLKQLSRNGMTKLLRAVCTNYACYFNRRYNRVGTLFQGKYKAVPIELDPYFLHVSRYIHLNPKGLDRIGPWKGSDPLSAYPYSSYNYYLGLKNSDWLHPQEITNFFRDIRKTHFKDILSYQSFVEDYEENTRDVIGNLALE